MCIVCDVDSHVSGDILSMNNILWLYSQLCAIRVWCVNFVALPSIMPVRRHVLAHTILLPRRATLPAHVPFVNMLWFGVVWFVRCYVCTTCACCGQQWDMCAHGKHPHALGVEGKGRKRRKEGTLLRAPTPLLRRYGHRAALPISAFCSLLSVCHGLLLGSDRRTTCLLLSSLKHQGCLGRLASL